MLETEERPPADRAPAPTRRPPGRWLAVAAAVAVVALIGGIVAMSGDDEDKIDTGSAPSSVTPAIDVMGLPESEDFVILEPGPYFIDPDGDASTPLRVTYDVAAEGWSAWIGAAKFNDDGHLGLSITTVTNLTRDACLDHNPQDPRVGPSVGDLATALAQLPPFEVTSAATDVTLQGYAGKHLQLTIPADLPSSGVGNDRLFSSCADDSLHTWFAPLLGGSFYGYNGEPGRTEDFWILDVEGTRLVIVTNSSPEASEQDLAELQAIFDSIRIHP